ncbi:MAG: type IX secretion system protein PorQ [Flavobacteriales bacterium]
MIRKFIIISIFLPNILFAQIQNSSYNSLNLNNSSRVLSMGGDVISIVGNDVSLAFQAPSLLNKEMNRQMSFNFVDYVSDINFISFHYAQKISNNLMIFSGLDAINYGEFIGSDATGNSTSLFTANQQIFTLGTAKQISDKFTLGTNIKLLNSQLESYHSLSLSSNVSTTYFNKENNLAATLLFKNMGKPIKSYTSNSENLPFEIQLGLSKSLQHLPFRYSLVIHHLNVYDISNDYNLNTIYDLTTNTMITKKETVAKKMLRHVILGGELNPFRKSLYLRAGFNFQRREDLKLSSSFSMSGFSWGMGFSVKKIQINYSRSALHSSSVLNSFSLITNLSNFGL